MRILNPLLVFFFFFNDPATTEIYTLSLHDALPRASGSGPGAARHGRPGPAGGDSWGSGDADGGCGVARYSRWPTGAVWGGGSTSSPAAPPRRRPSARRAPSASARTGAERRTATRRAM